MRITGALIAIMALISCGENPLQSVDTEGINIDLRPYRLDKAVFGIDFSKPAESQAGIYREAGDFWCEYVEGILGAGPCMDDSTIAIMKYFVEDMYMSDAYKTIEKTFDPDTEAKVNRLLGEGFRHYAYYYPDSVVPRVIYFHSGLNFGIYPTDSVMAIGLDFYLGPQSEVVRSLPPDVFPEYAKNNMDPAYIPTDALKGWLLVDNEASFSMENLQHTLLSYGRCMYLLDAMLPEVSDSLKMNWSAAQLEWAQQNEKNTWKELATQDVLFETQLFEIKKWLDDGPFTNAGAIPQESPPQLGIWMGWQIVRSYMRAHPEMTLQELMAVTDFDMLMRDYRP
ncbi:MAG: hypothetical protein JNM00_13590 [Flavobacteriales bacterium]|nr:hypothetical protein [Flavobacteriales bacterium]